MNAVFPRLRRFTVGLLIVALAGCGSGDDPALTGIAVTPAAPNGQLLAAALQFSATGTYSDGSTRDISSMVTWGSSSTAVASITSSGLSTSVGGGSTTISATLSGITGSTVYTVTPAALSWNVAGWDTVYWQ